MSKLKATTTLIIGLLLASSPLITPEPTQAASGTADYQQAQKLIRRIKRPARKSVNYNVRLTSSISNSLNWQLKPIPPSLIQQITLLLSWQH